jgi:dihydrofolate reductase
MLTLIAGRDRKGIIGKDGTIPWHAPEDLAFFQRETTGGAVIMGRKTWDSLPKKPLPRRLNIVVTSQPGDGSEALFVPIDRALPSALEAGHARIYAIGGEAIYRAFLPLADRLLLTEVDVEVADGDTRFPDFDPTEWTVGLTLALRGAAPKCTLVEYLRVR